MPSLLHRDDGGEDGLCRECEARPAAGPCVACEAMICADCGVMSRDPSGHRVICLSCARLVADVEGRARPRRAPPRVLVALLLLAVFAAGAAALLYR